MGVVRGTMIVATIAWALGEALMRRSSASDRLARAISTIGIALALTHVVLAFQLVYAWNHETAVIATVKQAADRFGWGWRGGIYINYGFLALWIGDVCWWWLAPRSIPRDPCDRNDAIRAVYLHVPQRSGDLRFRSRPPGGDCFSVNRDTRQAPLRAARRQPDECAECGAIASSV